MTYDLRDLHGVWVNLDDESVLRLEEDGDFRLTAPDDDSTLPGQRISMANDISGKWAVEDGEFRLSIDLRSMKLSSPSRIMAIGLAITSLLLRFAKTREVVYGQVTHLTGTDLWIEDSQGTINKFKKK